jgi:hypothetical protein
LIIIILSAVCLIIPAIILFVWFNFTAYFVIIERKYYFKALSESKALIKGRWWKVFGRILLPYLIMMLLSIVTGLATVRVIKGGSISFSMLYFVVSSLMSNAGMVLLIIFEVLLFKDLKGLDNQNSTLQSKVQDQPI